MELIFHHPFIFALLIFIAGLCFGTKMASSYCKDETSRHHFDVVRPATANCYRLLMLAELDMASSCSLRARDKAHALREEMASYRTLANLDKRIQELSGENTDWERWLELEIDLSGCHELSTEADKHIELACQYQALMNELGNNASYSFVFDQCRNYAREAIECVQKTHAAKLKFNVQNHA